MHKLIVSVLLLLIGHIATAQIATPTGGAPQLLIPAAGSVQGANGELFRSDITIRSYRLQTVQLVRLQWLPEGSSGAAVRPVTVTIEPLETLASEDFVSQVLGQSGLGAILVTGVTSSGEQDPEANLVATERIWSNQPRSSGTVSQNLPVLATTELATYTVEILGLRRDSRYRFNVGVINIDSAPHTFRISTGTMTTTREIVDIVVPALSMQQVTMAGGAVDILQAFVSNLDAGVVPNPAISSWIAYGSSVDNVTGDSWSSIGRTRSGLTP
jgi:hypothetical protein